MAGAKTREAMEDLGMQIDWAISYAAEGRGREAYQERTLRHTLAVVRMAGRLSGRPVEAAITRAMRSSDCDLEALVIRVVGRVPAEKAEALLTSAEVRAAFEDVADEGRPLLDLLAAHDPEAVCRHLWAASDAAGWGIDNPADRGPGTTPVEVKVGPVAAVIPATPEGRAAYWTMLAWLIWGMVANSYDGPAIAATFGQPDEVVRRRAAVCRALSGFPPR